MGNPIVLYDGVCGLCNRLVQFILRHDSQRSFRFASLQSEFATRILAQRALGATNLDTVYVLLNRDLDSPREELLARSDAALFILRELGGVWGIAGWFLRGLPRGVRDWGYAVIARNRYRVFGRYGSCPVPGEDVRSRFLDF